MLTAASLRALKILIVGSHKCFVLPFEWDMTRNEMMVSKNRLMYIIWTLTCVFLWFETFYQFTTIYLELGDPSVPFDAYLNLVVHSTTRLSANLYQTAMIFEKRRNCQFINQIFRLNDRFKELYPPSLFPDICYKPMTVLVFVAFTHPFAVMFSYIGEHRASRYWSSVVIPKSIAPFTIPIFAGIELYVSIFANCGVLISVFALIMCFSTTNCWITLLNNKEIDLGAHNLTQLSVYRTLQIFNRLYNSGYKIMWTIGLTVMCVDHVLCNSCMIRLAGIVEMPAYLVFPLGVLTFSWFERTMFDSSGFMQEVSKEFAFKLGLTRNKEQRAVARSCRRVAVETPYFYMQRSTSFTFFDVVLNYTINVLLGF